MQHVTKHYKNQRHYREYFIIKYITIGEILISVTWDRGHPHGPEIHHVTDTGIIIIENAITHNLVTRYIARPNQIKRLYKRINEEPPQDLLKLATIHQKKHYNKI